MLAATTEDIFIAYDPTDGSVEFESALDSYGYTKPLGGLLATVGTVVANVRGTAYVIDASGGTVWGYPRRCTLSCTGGGSKTNAGPVLEYPCVPPKGLTVARLPT